MSASLWGCELKWCFRCGNRNLWWSASLWGCELKYINPITEENTVASASLWGCELKCHDHWFLSDHIPVSLLVRLWVEIMTLIAFCNRYLVSLLVRLWVEIVRFCPCSICGRQPPCEAVSWNAPSRYCWKPVLRSASLWGCELKWYSTHR